MNTSNPTRLVMSKRSRRLSFAFLPIFLFVFLTLTAPQASAQGGQTLFGEVRIDDKTYEDAGPRSIMVILYRDGGGEVGRQAVSNRSRYRFINLLKGDYHLAVEVDSNEIARLRIVVGELSPSPYGFQQDLILALKPRASKPGVLATADFYNRSRGNKSLFEKAQQHIDKKQYDEATALLQQIVENDKLDFQAWTLLGIVRFVQGKFAEAEQAYLNALDAKPKFVLALLNLGKLHASQKNYEAAIGPLSRAVQAQPQSAEANFLLGEVLIQNREGSKAIPYLKDAVKLGRSEGHLHLGWLYNAAGMKDKAAAEYEEFLKKKPDYGDRKKLEDYIRTHHQ